jgi:hypothetical protein
MMLPETFMRAGWIKFFISLFFLNLLLSTHLWIPFGQYENLLTSGIDTVLILFLIVLFSFILKPEKLYSKAIMALIAVVLSIHINILLTEAIYLSVYQKSISILDEIQFLIPALDLVLPGSSTNLRIIVLTLFFLVLFSISFTTSYVIVRNIIGFVNRINEKKIFIPLALMIFLSPINSDSGVFRSIQAFQKREPVIRQARTAPGSLSGFQSTDGRSNIAMFMVESYGSTLITNPEHRERGYRILQDLSERFANAGYSSASGLLDSPAFGGRSWLADGSVLSGIRLENQKIYDETLKRGSAALLTAFRQAGYTSIVSAPGTSFADDQWKRFYSFDRYFFQDDFGYEGPFVAFGNMPDQYQIHAVNQQIKSIDQKLFIQFILATSHMPWDRVPSYYEDWSRLRDGTIYNNRSDIRFFDNNVISGTEYSLGFTETLSYTLNSVAGFLEKENDSFSLVIILGDHQPKYPVTERGADSGVLVHFLSRDPKLIEKFLSFGYQPGFIPQAGRAQKGIEELTWELLRLGTNQNIRFENMRLESKIKIIK